jgi:hypothetical protein
LSLQEALRNTDEKFLASIKQFWKPTEDLKIRDSFNKFLMTNSDLYDIDMILADEYDGGVEGFRSFKKLSYRRDKSINLCSDRLVRFLCENLYVDTKLFDFIVKINECKEFIDDDGEKGIYSNNI